MALGSILDGPKNIDEKIAALVPALLDLMHDPETAVRDTVAWTLGRVAEHHINALAPHFIRFMETMITSLNDPEPRVASNVCWVRIEGFSILRDSSTYMACQPHRPSTTWPKHSPVLCPIIPSLNILSVFAKA